jgi:hypothetical protein
VVDGFVFAVRIRVWRDIRSRGSMGQVWSRNSRVVIQPDLALAPEQTASVPAVALRPEGKGRQVP